jgi:hypothetical protein
LPLHSNRSDNTTCTGGTHQQRDGASGIVEYNITNANNSWFTNPVGGDLHLSSAVSAVVDAGQLVSRLTDDFDSQSRPQGGGIDIGADEYQQ